MGCRDANLVEMAERRRSAIRKKRPIILIVDGKASCLMFRGCSLPQIKDSKYCHSHSESLLKFVATLPKRHRDMLLTINFEVIDAVLSDKYWLQFEQICRLIIHCPHPVWVIGFEFVGGFTWMFMIPIELSVQFITGELVFKCFVEHGFKRWEDLLKFIEAEVQRLVSGEPEQANGNLGVDMRRAKQAS